MKSGPKIQPNVWTKGQPIFARSWGVLLSYEPRRCVKVPEDYWQSISWTKKYCQWSANMFCQYRTNTLSERHYVPHDTRGLLAHLSRPLLVNLKSFRFGRGGAAGPCLTAIRNMGQPKSSIDISVFRKTHNFTKRHFPRKQNVFNVMFVGIRWHVYPLLLTIWSLLTESQFRNRPLMLIVRYC